MLEQVLHFAFNIGQRLRIYDVIRSNINLTCFADTVSIHSELRVQVYNEIVSVIVMRFIHKVIFCFKGLFFRHFPLTDT